MSKPRPRSAPSTPKRPPGPALSRPVTPSPALAACIGPDPLPRAAAVSKLWAHIKSKCHLSAEDQRIIVADEKLRTLAGKDHVGQLEIAGLVSRNVTAA